MGCVHLAYIILYRFDSDNSHEENLAKLENAEVLKTFNEDLQLNGFAPEFNRVIIVVGLCNYCLHHL